MKIKIILFMLFAVGAVWSNTECVHDETNFRCVKYLYNYDADSLTFEIEKVHPLLGRNAKIRVFGIDSPELKSKNACEKERAIYAKKLVTQKLKDAKRIDLLNVSRGKFFRIVAKVMVDGKSLGDFLLEKGLAYKYYGGKKEKIDWCAQLQSNIEPGAIY